MQLVLTDHYEDLSRKAADDLLAILKEIPEPLICAASGDSPAGLYRQLAARRPEYDPARWCFAGLDEWAGMNGSDEGSCRYYLDRQLFGPLGIPEERIAFFDGRAGDGAAECNRVTRFIEARGGMDVAIIGLGLNGHVGMNEP